MAACVLPRKVKADPDILFAEMEGEAILLCIKTDQYHGLDAVGTRMWNLLIDGSDTGSVVAQLLEEYDVDESTLRADLAAFIHKLAEAQLIILE